MSNVLVRVGEAGSEGLIDTRQDLVIVSWNVHKGLHVGLTQELQELCEEEQVSILALQEARPDLAVPPGFGGHHAASYKRLGAPHPEGVLTAARSMAFEAVRLRSPHRELLVLTPKAALISRYALRTGGVLTVANIHGLNFDPRGKLLVGQLEDLASRVGGFDGPMVVTGDFNTWNDDRKRAVDALAQRLGLVEVAPPGPGGRTGTAGPASLERALGLDRNLHLDRMYVRDLRPLRVAWLEEHLASDHVPLLARLAWS